MILEFLKVYWMDILIIVLFLLGILFLVKSGNIKKVKELAFYLVCKAEQEFGSGTGQAKKAAAISWLYERLPFIVRFMFTRQQIENYIEEAVKRLKKMLDSDINLLSYKDELEYELPMFEVKEE